jgi:hypothetical protein
VKAGGRFLVGGCVCLGVAVVAAIAWSINHVTVRPDVFAGLLTGAMSRDGYSPRKLDEDEANAVREFIDRHREGWRVSLESYAPDFVILSNPSRSASLELLRDLAVINDPSLGWWRSSVIRPFAPEELAALRARLHIPPP